MLIPNLEDKEEQEIEEVKDKATIKRKIYYLVKWEGWPTKYNQQINEDAIGSAQEAIRRYKRTKKKKIK